MKRIPKIIHYCWFGKGEKNELIEKCIESWKKYLPDYKIIEWNEDNFDINSNTYVKQAYECRKWAFVTDYVRLYVIYTYGGIYLDTDVEILKNLDIFLDDDAFSGYETDFSIPTGIIASKKGNDLIKLLLKDYDKRYFIKQDGSYDYTTNVETITNYIKKNFNINLDGKYQKIKYNFVIYPKEYFCPKDWKDGSLKITNNTYAIHHFNGSWCELQEERKKRKLKKRLKKIIKISVIIGIIILLKNYILK